MQKHEGEEFNGFFVVQFLPWNWNNPPLLFFFKDKKWGACMPLTHHINICWLLSFKFYWHIYVLYFCVGFSWIVTFNTWLISCWEENNCCYRLRNWQNEDCFHSKWKLQTFWVKKLCFKKPIKHLLLYYTEANVSSFLWNRRLDVI